MESPVLIDFWTVDPSLRGELVQRILKLTRSATVAQPGFESAQVYESSDGGAVIVSIRMRTVEQRQNLTDSPEVRQGMRELRTIAHSHARLYRLVESFGEPH
jgi:hypothetical protein